MDENERRAHREKFNSFCYVCGKYTVKSDRKHLSDIARRCYDYYFPTLLLENVEYAPEFTCLPCIGALTFWWKRKRFSLPFAVPMTWNDPGEHQSDNCYACVNSTIGLNRKSKSFERQ